MILIVRVKLKHIIFVFLIVLCSFCILFWPTGNSWVQYWQDKLFSPGPVSLAHQRDVGGSEITCQGCHEPGKAITNSICRRCHDRKYFENNRPLLADSHELLDKKDYCLRCHGEHHGDYMALKISRSTAQVHKTLPMETNRCVTCHRLAGRQAHPSLINEDCGSCHKNFQWASEFKHKEFLAKAPTSDTMLQLCRKCHITGYHYTIGRQSREGCIFCHEFWGKRRENRSVPFPEELFKDVKIETGKFGLN